MGKCWMIESVEEKADAFIEYVVGDLGTYNPPPLKITEYPSNPLEPILEFWEKWDKQSLLMPKRISDFAFEAREAIQKSMAITEAKP